VWECGGQVYDNDFGEINNNKTHMKNDASFVLPTQNGKQGYSSSSGIQETKTKKTGGYRQDQNRKMERKSVST
jgi:hypothetical protein